MGIMEKRKGGGMSRNMNRGLMGMDNAGKHGLWWWGDGAGERNRKR